MMSNKQAKNQVDINKKLIDDLKNEDPDVRYTAAWALVKIGKKSKS